MNKKAIVSILVFVVAILIGGFLVLKNKKQQAGKNNQAQIVQQEIAQNSQEQSQQAQSTINQPIQENIASELPKGWKVYKNEDFGIQLHYPENRYVVEEESGMVHFYYKDGTAPAGSQKTNYININMSKEDAPKDVVNIEELFNKQFSNNNGKSDTATWSGEAELKNIGTNRFIVAKYYNEGQFYSVLFVAMSQNKVYYISFGGYWNKIKNTDYELANKIMESFRIIK